MSRKRKRVRSWEKKEGQILNLAEKDELPIPLKAN
jgi:hypothetical protein